MEVVSLAKSGPRNRLTRDELAILRQLCAAGKSNDEIARALNCQVGRITYQTAKVRRALGTGRKQRNGGGDVAKQLEAKAFFELTEEFFTQRLMAKLKKEYVMIRRDSAGALQDILRGAQ